MQLLLRKVHSVKDPLGGSAVDISVYALIVLRGKSGFGLEWLNDIVGADPCIVALLDNPVEGGCSRVVGGAIVASCSAGGAAGLAVEIAAGEDILQCIGVFLVILYHFPVLFPCLVRGFAGYDAVVAFALSHYQIVVNIGKSVVGSCFQVQLAGIADGAEVSLYGGGVNLAAFHRLENPLGVAVVVVVPVGQA